MATTSVTPTSSSTSSTSSSTNSLFGSDDTTTFLQLLTTELQNQDPTSPMDPTEMVGQLVALETLSETMSIGQNVQQIANSFPGSSTSSS